VYGQSCGWKRPWQALHESTCKLMHSESLDLNALAGDIDTPNRVRDSADGVRHSEGIIRYVTLKAKFRLL
jgi:hypothetical protein